MEGPAAYGMKFQARALAAVEADPGRSRWLVGSTALREDPNELHLVQHDAAADHLAAVAVFPHAAGEVWDVAPAPAGLDPGLCFTAHAAGRRHGATLWRLCGGAGEAAGEEGRLEAEAALGVPEGQRVRRVAWGGAARVAAVSERQVGVWDLGEAGESPEAVAVGAASDPAGFAAGAWDPHSGGRSLGAAEGARVAVWDVRAGLAKVATVFSAYGHVLPVRHIAYSRATPHRLLSCGDDGAMCVWDPRRPARPVRMVRAHAHWVWAAAFNPVHGDLIASASSDTLVGLWHLPAKAEGQDGEHGGAGAGVEDGVAPEATFDDHEDSVYAVAWSAADPWLLASLSHDGRVACHRVSDDVKYKVLL